MQDPDKFCIKCGYEYHAWDESCQDCGFDPVCNPLDESEHDAAVDAYKLAQSQEH